MDIDSALGGARIFLDNLHLEDGYGELGEWTWFYRDALKYVIKYAETMRATPTTHDSKAEMEHWDAFFAGEKEEG